MNLRPPYYWYRNVEVRRVIDGDTLDLILRADVGFGTIVEFRGPVRLAGINTPEIVGAERERGLAAKEALAGYIVETIQNEGGIRVMTAQKDKYGRRLALLVSGVLQPMPRASIMVLDHLATGWSESLNGSLVKAGHATEYWGEGPKG